MAMTLKGYRIHLSHAKKGEVIMFTYGVYCMCGDKEIREMLAYKELVGVLQSNPQWNSGSYRVKIMLHQPVEGLIAEIDVPEGQMVYRRGEVS